MSRILTTGTFWVKDGEDIEFSVSFDGTSRLLSVGGLDSLIKLDMQKLTVEKMSLVPYLSYLVEEAMGGGISIVGCSTVHYDRDGNSGKSLEHDFGEVPSIVRMTLGYAASLYKWNKAGRPVRKYSEVVDIVTDLCGTCTHYKGSSVKGQCKLCGCGIGLGMTASSRNKVKMATEHCPIGKW